jgi:APA family basic amino acid/polyamine antiporter
MSGTTSTQPIRPNRTRMGFWGATALVFGNVIGASIFMLPASIAPYGWNAVVAWIISLTGALCLAWVFSKLAKHFPQAGGAHGFMQLGVGDGAAFLGSWGYLMSIYTANAAITIIGTSYLTRLIPGMRDIPGAETATGLLLIALLTWANARALAGDVQIVSSIIKILPFVAVIGLASWTLLHHGMAALAPVHSVPITLPATVSAIGLTFYAMLGFESATVPSDAVEDGERTVPRATMIGTGLTGVVSIFSTCAVALMLPVAALTVSKAPVADFIGGYLGNSAGLLVAVCAVVSCFGCLNGWLLVGAELPAAMCERGSLPQWFGVRNAQGVPVRALLLCSIITAAFVLMASTRVGIAAVNFATLLATATNLVMYLLCTIAAIRFMRDGRLPRTISLVIASLGAVIFSLWAFYGTGWESLGWGAVLLAAGWPLHRFTQRAAKTALDSPVTVS